MICPKCKGNVGYCDCDEEGYKKFKVGDKVRVISPLRVDDMWIKNYLYKRLVDENRLGEIFTINYLSDPKHNDGYYWLQIEGWLQFEGDNFLSYRAENFRLVRS